MSENIPRPPKVTLSTTSNPLTAILPKTPGLTPAERAVERFSVSGNAIVTGGTGGLGFEACRALLEHGLSGLCIFDLASGFQTQGSVQQLREEFPSAKILEEIVDVSDEKSVHQGVENTVAQLGSVNTLLCFAGIAKSSNSAETSLEEWQTVIAVNSTGSWLCAQAVAREMIKQGTGGSIVFTASIAGQRALFPSPAAAYGFSKAGLLQLKSSLAAEWAQYGIRVNSISPGYMDTRMIDRAPSNVRKIWEERNPMGRIGDPSELAGAIILFCSPAGRYITGVDIVVDGGGHVF